MKKSILFGGKAGQGPNILTNLLGEALVKYGYYVFYTRDYQSVIRGGHNFNVLTFSEQPVYSNESKFDIIVALDDRTEQEHKKDLKKNGLILKGENENMFYAGSLFKILGLSFDLLDVELKKLDRYEDNLKEAKEGFLKEKAKIELVGPRGKGLWFQNGSRGIAEGAIKSGLDIYYAYPMTPATPLLFELAGMQEKNNFIAVELENEISVMIAALGSSATGAKAMIGTSGGGFDLMTEGLSMSGMAEIPVVCYLACRPGPSTGVATYTSQADLNLALYSGHGEFSRVVVAPGDPEECQELTSEAFYLSQKYKIPSIIFSDKHLGESFYTLYGQSRIQKSEKNVRLIRYNSYEHLDSGEATDDAAVTIKNFDRRMKKQKEIEKEAERFEMFKTFGENSGNLIVGFGSVKGAIVDAIKNLDCRFMQILYLEPFSNKIKAELEKAKKIILVENDATGQLVSLIRQKTGIEIADRILRYDGRPFLSDELESEIKRRIK